MLTIFLGEAKNAKFWHSPWLDGIKLKDIAPSILDISKQRNFSLNKTFNHEFWIRSVNFNRGISFFTLLSYTSFGASYKRFN
jgi:hypothetical protein